VRPAIPVAVLLVCLATSSRAEEAVSSDGRNLYEWCAIAPFVASVRIEGEDGRWTLVTVEESLRGDLVSGELVRVDHRRANRERGSQADRMRLEPGGRYLVLLEPSSRGGDGPAAFDLVRDVRGARRLPPEGAEAILSAVRTFVEIQAGDDFSATWARYRGLLDGPNPVITETVLDQYLKFARGDRELLGVLEPLLDHPRPSVREKTARLLALVVAETDDTADPALGAARSALLAKARRDPAVAVRVAATAALGRFVDPESDAVLREIARDDPDQAVRYEAERILFDRAAGAPARSD